MLITDTSNDLAFFTFPLLMFGSLAITKKVLPAVNKSPKCRSVIKIEDDNKTYNRVERTRGTFYRRFSLPDTADSERIEAKGKYGILEVVIPKHEKVQPRKIEVKS